MRSRGTIRSRFGGALVGRLVMALALPSCMAAIDDGTAGERPGGGGGGGATTLPPLPTPPTGGPPPPAMMQACKTRDPGPALIRRLTRSEYDNTIRDLLGDATKPANAFPEDERGAGFTNDAQALSVSPLHAQSYLDAAEKIVARAVANAAGFAKIVPCAPASGDAACGAKFIDAWGKRAWRRPLDASEKTELGKVFTTAMGSYGFTTAIQMVMEVMLQSPQFLYRVELGAAGVQKLSPWETASRLSYLLWGSMPDAELFTAAENNQLGTPEQVAIQARRLLKDARAKQMMASFHDQWLELVKVDEAEKDPKLFPGFDAPTRSLLRQEAAAFVEAVIASGDGTVATLLTAPFSMMNAKLAAFYGVKGPATDAFERVELDPAQRGGFLTRGAFLAGHALANQTDPVRRGKFVREQLLCQILPSPPNDIVIRPPDLDPNLTTRERFSRHATDQLCATCHKLMDPIGLGFENYDALGRWRATENGKAIDVSGQINDADVAGPFAGAADLGRKLAGSAQVRECVVKQWFRFGYGRSETPLDACSLETLKALYTAGKYDVRELLVGLTQTDAFLYRRGAP
jgi:hypothetical protein